jgi:acyl carrier protein
MDREILGKVIKLVAKYADCSPAELSANTRLSETGIESIGVAELIFDLESEYDIHIEDTDEIQNRFNLGTIGDIVKMIMSKALEPVDD